MTQIQEQLERWRVAERALQQEVEAGGAPWFLRLSLRYAKARVFRLAAQAERERAAAARRLEDEDTVICSCPFEVDTVDMRLP